MLSLSKRAALRPRERKHLCMKFLTQTLTRALRWSLGSSRHPFHSEPHMAIVNLQNVTYKYPLTDSACSQEHQPANRGRRVRRGYRAKWRGQIHALLHAGWLCSAFLQR